MTKRERAVTLEEIEAAMTAVSGDGVYSEEDDYTLLVGSVELEITIYAIDRERNPDRYRRAALAALKELSKESPK